MGIRHTASSIVPFTSDCIVFLRQTFTQTIPKPMLWTGYKHIFGDTSTALVEVLNLFAFYDCFAQGDSGAPLLQAFAPEGNITFGTPATFDIVVGITSFGAEDDCRGPMAGAELPSVYTRIRSFRNWIDEKMEVSRMMYFLCPKNMAFTGLCCVFTNLRCFILLKNTTKQVYTNKNCALKILQEIGQHI